MNPEKAIDEARQILDTLDKENFCMFPANQKNIIEVASLLLMKNGKGGMKSALEQSKKVLLKNYSAALTYEIIIILAAGIY